MMTCDRGEVLVGVERLSVDSVYCGWGDLGVEMGL